MPRTVLPWLSSTWWGGLAILGGIVLIGVLLSLIPRARPPRNPPIQAPDDPSAQARTESVPTPVVPEAADV